MVDFRNAGQGMFVDVAAIQRAIDAENAAKASLTPTNNLIPVPRLDPSNIVTNTSQPSQSNSYAASPPPPPPPPAPILPQFKSVSSNFAIKQAPIDTVVFDDASVPVGLLEDLMYEDIGGIKLANMSRSDLIDGQEVSYSAIKNLSALRRRFNPNNIISTASSAGNNFSRFSIDLISRGMNIPYIDADGNLVVEIDDVYANEVIEVEIASSGTINAVNI